LDLLGSEAVAEHAAGGDSEAPWEHINKINLNFNLSCGDIYIQIKHIGTMHTKDTHDIFNKSNFLAKFSRKEKNLSRA
jgi:hypothetical protein